MSVTTLPDLRSLAANAVNDKSRAAFYSAVCDWQDDWIRSDGWIDYLQEVRALIASVREKEGA